MSSDIRIVHVFPNAARLSCGPCNAIMAFMKCQLQHGLDVCAISLVDEHIPAERKQSIEHLPIQEYPSTEKFCEAALKLAENPRTVFHFHGLSPWADKIGRALQKNSTPYVFTSHGQLHFYNVLHGLKKFTYLNVVNPFIRNAGGLHFLTRREQQRSKFILPLWRKTTLVQPNLVELPDAQKITPTPRATMNIPQDAFLFAYLGRLDVNTKGLDFLMTAFAEIAQEKNCRLILIGPDFSGGREFLQQLAKKLGCENKVIFLGSQVGEAKWNFLKMADAFVSPSRWEACSIAQAEAIGLGLPTIVSNEINLAPEMVERRVALAAPLNSKALAADMRRLMGDAELRDSIVKAGQRWVEENFAFASAAPRFKHFYESVLANISR